MKETENNIEPGIIWAKLSKDQRKACLYLTVPVDQKTGAGEDYLKEVGIEESVLNELKKLGIVESKPTWKMYQDEVDKLESKAQPIREKMGELDLQITSYEREIWNEYRILISGAESKSKESRFRISVPGLYDYIADSFQNRTLPIDFDL